MLQSIPTGFSRPVFESQSTFRAVLQAMSAPGRPVPMPVHPQGPAGWSGALSALVLTLCDMDTPVWLDPSAASAEALRFLRFHCSCPLSGTPGGAAFGVILDPSGMPALEAFAAGDAEYPERSATLLLALPSLDPSGPSVRIHGPGIAGTADMPLGWLPPGFTGQWRVNAGLYPRGVDAILVGPEAIVGLPRTLVMEEEPCM